MPYSTSAAPLEVETRFFSLRIGNLHIFVCVSAPFVGTTTIYGQTPESPNKKSKKVEKK
jgi:hypothetical protein